MIVLLVLIAFIFLLSFAAVVFIAAHFHKLPFLQRLSEKSKVSARAASFGLVLPVGLFALINVTTFLVVLLHLAAAFALCDLVFLIIRKVAGKNAGAALRCLSAVLLTVVYLGIGWFMAHHVFATTYTVSTEKKIGGNMRIVQIADSHLGITLDGESFTAQMERISQYKPDLVVITGDFVDDDSSYEDMLAACRALGKIDTKYGIFFVFGNHDRGYYNSHNFNSDQLIQALEKNGVIILEDNAVMVDDRFYVVGRKDRSDRSRQEMYSLVDGLDLSKYCIVLDHQPNDYENEADSDVDLVLSGHTHGGHLFPLGWIGLISGANDQNYGIEEREDTTFIVTSGISGWAIPFKTGCFSEFVVIDIVQE